MVNFLIGHLDQSETVSELDGADVLAVEAGLARNGTHEVAGTNPCQATDTDKDASHTL